MTDGDKLLIYIDDNIFAVDADAVAAVVETERFFMLPMLQSHSFSSPSLPHGERQGEAGFIKGVITRRGDVVVVVDIGELFGAQTVQDEGKYKVIVLKKDALCLGIYYGAKGLSFLWREDLKDLEFKPLTGDYIQGILDPSGKKIRILDWQRILEETQQLASGKRQ